MNSYHGLDNEEVSYRIVTTLMERVFYTAGMRSFLIGDFHVAET
jgi:hypothetical protein